jgi:hypothetical protein
MILNADRTCLPGMAKFGYDRNHDGAWRLINFAASRASFGKYLAVKTGWCGGAKEANIEQILK